MTTPTAWVNASLSNWPLEPRNLSRLNDARLQAVSSRNMYSEQGFEALIRSVALQVCQRLMGSPYCMPGSPQCQAESAISRSKSRALNLSQGLPSFTLRVHQSPVSSTALL